MPDILPDYVSQILDAAESEDVKKVLIAVQNEICMLKQCEIVEKFQTSQLLDTTTYLYTLKEQFSSAVKKINTRQVNKTKKDFALEIVKFCKEIRPSTCRKCQEEYIPCEVASQDVDYVQCVICEKTEHTCLSAKEINPNNGIVYMCLTCQKTIFKVGNVAKMLKIIPVPENDTEVTPEQTPEADTGSRNQLPDENNGSRSQTNNNERGEEHIKVKSGKVCELYKQQLCPHGLVGRNCEDDHPRHCRFHCQFGYCKWGEKCYFLHPVLCENSRTSKTCYNDDCKRTHLKGTRRKVENRQRPQYERSDSHTNNRERSHTNYNQQSDISVWNIDGRNEIRQKLTDEQNKNNKPVTTVNRTARYDVDISNTFLERLEGVKSEIYNQMNTSITLLFKQLQEENQKQLLSYQYQNQAYVKAFPALNQMQDQTMIQHTMAPSTNLPTSLSTNMPTYMPMMYPNVATHPTMVTT